MPISPKSNWILVGILMAAPAAFAAGQPPAGSTPIDLAQRQVTAYLTNLADLHCTESVTQEKLAANGHAEVTERAKYDYLIMMNGSGEDFQLNESRIEASTNRHKTAPAPMLVSNGVATVLLVFHPYYRDSFTFESGADEMVDGRLATPVHFAHIPGRRTPAALALRGREYPLELQGTAWIDKQSGEVARIDASLLRDMSDVGLRSMNVHVEYKPANLGKALKDMSLPTLAVVEVTTPRQHWRNTHTFDGYKSFSTDAEQDPNVKVRAANAVPESGDTAAVANPDNKEKP